MNQPDRVAQHGWRRFRPVSLIPGDVIVECLTCSEWVCGLTAHHALEAFKRHEAAHAHSSGTP